MSKSHQVTRYELELLLEQYEHLRQIANEVAAEESIYEDIHILAAYYAGMVDGLCIPLGLVGVGVPEGCADTHRTLKQWGGIDGKTNELLAELIEAWKRKGDRRKV